MKIVVDDKIPFLREVLCKHFEEVVFTDSITREKIRDADAIIVRTRTACNEKLLHNSNVKAIVTATIGTDHIDLNYCNQNNIATFNAKGCNASAVAQWVFASIRQIHNIDAANHANNTNNHANKTIGIVGVGNVGTIVAAMASKLGLKTLLCDPPRQQQQMKLQGADIEGGTEFVELEYLLQNSDIVTLHVPLDETTRLFANEYFFNNLKPNATLLNASRGEVIDENALLKAINDKVVSHCALDVWANEPNINTTLLGRVNIATPHIAGYSARGKAMGSQMAVRALAKHLGINELEYWEPQGVFVNEEPAAYDIKADDIALRLNPSRFEFLRSNYILR